MSESRELNIEYIFSQKGIKPTSNRVLVYKTLAETSVPLSLLDIETILVTVDRASIFRVLNVFVSADMVHSFEDGSGSVKYELCHGQHQTHSMADMHPHFHCEECGRTFCITDSTIQQVKLPAGFEVKGANFTLKGLCPECNSKK